MESAISSVALKARFGLNAMLLWPLHKKTSPKATFESVCDFPPDVLKCGWEKGKRKKNINHILQYSMRFRCNPTALRAFDSRDVEGGKEKRCHPALP